MRLSELLPRALIALSVAAAGAASALEYEFGEVEFNLKSRLSAGVQVRTQERSESLIGKLNVEGQQELCNADDCISFDGNPAPNQRLVDARGSFFGTNRDDGNLNYDRYDLTAAPLRLTSDLKATWGDFLFRVSGRGTYDVINADFQEPHPNTLFQPAETDRRRDVERYYAASVELLNAYAQYSFTLGERSGAFSVGNQIVRWGESGLVAVNSIAEINPPNATILHTPGFEIAELFQPVPLALLSLDLFEGAGMELIYQFGWVPVKPDARGAFLSDIDTFGDEDGLPVNISLGQFPEDPNGQNRFAGAGALISGSSTTARLLHQEFGEPRGGGQYGAKFSYYADWLNDGTELGLYYLHYHSRYPYLSLYATDDSCMRDSTSVVDAAIDCRGFNGTLSLGTLEDLLGIDLSGLTGPREPLPIDTLRIFVDYPEDIDMFGVSANTTAFGWSFAAEYSFRPNVPLQVGITDVVYTGLQPVFPRQDVIIPVPGASITIPGARNAIPDYLSVYRGLDNNNPNNDINANQLVRGYERMKVGQFDLTALQVFSDNPIGADQIIFIGEAGFTHVLDMPSKDVLQFEGFGYQATHASPGADGTGSGGVTDTRRFTPTQQTSGFGDSFAWGLRTLIIMEYNNIFGYTFMPTIIAAWDIGGIAPFPISNFAEGRKEVLAGTQMKISNDITGTLFYQWFTGGGLDNTRRDRDNVSLSFAYNF